MDNTLPNPNSSKSLVVKGRRSKKRKIEDDPMVIYRTVGRRLAYTVDMFANVSIAFGVVPDLSKAIDDANGQKLEEALEMVQEGVTCCRTDDCGSLKWPGLNYVLLNTSALVPSIPPTDTSKSLCGFHHPQLARLLCLHKYISEFDQSPNQYVDRILNGDLIFKVWPLPSFLYDQTKPYNLDDIQDGLFCGHVLVRVSRDHPCCVD
ncbi:hypothetical protein M404DRAFT_36097 [Pisolithus tinctorius Marx 270]|uniref:Uncharacterized protein n=1 Tax=Pisolithus tinctorius Marx 270 TaxID=870435 RepID=A0A0C3ND04_PISTI|nr:hypothetical protein M404DRAFT_36097 [Pisolithus tinctorius Marx 270]